MPRSRRIRTTDDPLVPSWIRELAASISDRDIAWMADADYGHDADQHAAALRIMRDAPHAFRRVDWHPHEVLALTQWCNPATPSRWDGASGSGDAAQQHRCRLFACLMLLIGACYDDTCLLSVNEPLIIAFDSVVEAFPVWSIDFGRWCLSLPTVLRREDESVYAPLAAFVAAAAVVPRPDLTMLNEAVAAVDAAMADIERHGWRLAEVGRRYGRLIEMSPHDQRHDLWQAHLDRALARLQGVAPTCAAAAWLRRYMDPTP